MLIIPDWTKRNLNPGYVWQTYFVSALHYVTNADFQRIYGRQKSVMDFEKDRWMDRVKAYTEHRVVELGMHLKEGNLHSHCQDEPSMFVPLEQSIWKIRDLAFVWSVWAMPEGPVKEELCNREGYLPLENFWPHHITVTGGVAEVLDATTLTPIEQGYLIATNEYDV